MSTKLEEKTLWTGGGDVKAIAWNTGAEYTQDGQRIAACEVDGGVWFVDADRGVYGWMPGCVLTKEAVMHRYHTNDYKSVPPPVYDLNVRQFRTSDYKDGTVDRVVRLYGEFRAALEKMALAFGQEAKAAPSLAHRIATAMTESISHNVVVRFEVATRSESIEAISAIREQSLECDTEDNGEDTLVTGTNDEGDVYRVNLVKVFAPRGWESVEGGAR